MAIHTQPHTIQFFQDIGALYNGMQHVLDKVTGRAQARKNAESREALDDLKEEIDYIQAHPPRGEKVRETLFDILAITCSYADYKIEKPHRSFDGSLDDKKLRKELGDATRVLASREHDHTFGFRSLGEILKLAPREIENVWKEYPEAFNLSDKDGIADFYKRRPYYSREGAMTSASGYYHFDYIGHYTKFDGTPVPGMRVSARLEKGRNDKVEKLDEKNLFKMFSKDKEGLTWNVRDYQDTKKRIETPPKPDQIQVIHFVKQQTKIEECTLLFSIGDQPEMPFEDTVRALSDGKITDSPYLAHDTLEFMQNAYWALHNPKSMWARHNYLKALEGPKPDQTI